MYALSVAATRADKSFMLDEDVASCTCVCLLRCPCGALCHNMLTRQQMPICHPILSTDKNRGRTRQPAHRYLFFSCIFARSVEHDAVYRSPGKSFRFTCTVEARLACRCCGNESEKSTWRERKSSSCRCPTCCPTTFSSTSACGELCWTRGKTTTTMRRWGAVRKAETLLLLFCFLYFFTT